MLVLLGTMERIELLLFIIMILAGLGVGLFCFFFHYTKMTLDRAVASVEIMRAENVRTLSMIRKRK
jgi:hypothetical protein